MKNISHQDEMAMNLVEGDTGRIAPGSVRSLLRLALVLTLAQLAPLTVGLYVAGLIAHQSSLSFSAYSLVTSLNMTVFVAVSSFLQALYYVGGRAIGRDEVLAYRDAILAGFVIGMFTMLIATLLSLLAGPIYAALGVNNEVIGQVGMIGIVAAVGILPAQLMVVYRVHAALSDRAGLVTAIQVLGAVVTAIAATAVVRYFTASPAQIVVWVVLAVSLVQWLMLVAAMASVIAVRRLRFSTAAPVRLDGRFRASVAMVWSVGWPIGAVVFLDSLTDFTSTLFVGRYWLTALPVHAVVWLWVIVSLMVPLGLGQAATQRIAVAHARGDIVTRNALVVVSILCAILFGAVVAVLFATFPRQIGGLLLSTPNQIGDGYPLLDTLMPLGGLVLALQAVIVVAAATLRGIGLTKAPLFQAFIGYCVIAIGAQYLFGVMLGYGPRGIWWGLVVGFAATAIAILWNCYSEFRRRQQPMPTRNV